MRCNVDPDRDGQAECVLTSERFYAQIEIESGALTYLFSREPSGGVHQVIGPSSQIISGLSDPQTWRPGTGLAADPAVIPGAFGESGMGYEPVSTGNGVTFISPNRKSQKAYTLQPDGLRLVYRAGQVKTLHIPLLLDPWRRFVPGWSARYHYGAQTGGWMAGVDGDGTRPVQVEIGSNTPVSGQAFTDAIPYTNRAENPNQDYPPGFYLPFPLVEVRLNTTPGQDTIVDITIQH